MSYAMTILFLALAVLVLTATAVGAGATLLYRAAGLSLPAAMARGAVAFAGTMTLGVLLIGLMIAVQTR